jgi:glycosyltransferase involved in cell wall biosynthesis
MRILLVTYHFPPDAEVGGVRPYQIARYLPEFGIEPWVLTVEARHAESPNLGLLAEGVSEDRIIRTNVLQTVYDRVKGLWRGLGRLREQTSDSAVEPVGGSERGAWAHHVLGYPDDKIGWRRPALRAVEEAMRRVGFDAILSTSPPRVATLVAASLAKRHRLPWVMDLRDPWWGWYHTSTSHDGRYAPVGFLQQRLFRRCVRNASLVVHNTERLRQLTCRIAPEASSKTRCIPNGCDLTWQARRDGGEEAAFRVSHYGHIMGHRSPTAFLLGLRSWLDARPLRPLSINVRFVGSGLGEADRKTQELGLRHLVEFVPSIPRQEVPAQMAGDFVLLLLANAQPLQVPGKTYEYLAAGRRILALADRQGATADLLGSQQDCIVAESPEEVRQALDRFHLDHERGEEAWVDRGPLLAELQYPRRVEQFAKLLDEVVRR